MSMVRPTPMKPKLVKQSRQRKGLRRVSRKMAPRLQKYRELKSVFLINHRWCEFKGCCNTAIDLHHMEGRGRNLLNYYTFMAVCRYHHDWIHSHPNAARKHGFLR